MVRAGRLVSRGFAALVCNISASAGVAKVLVNHIVRDTLTANSKGAKPYIATGARLAAKHVSNAAHKGASKPSMVVW